MKIALRAVINRYICRVFGNERFIPGTFILYDETSGQVELYDMGHSLTFLLRNELCVRPKTGDRSIPLGIDENLSVEPVRFRLKKDDMLVVITDGMEDQKNPRGDIYGINRLMQVIHKSKGRDLTDIKKILFEDIRNFRENQARNDDMTLLLLRQKREIKSLTSQE